MKKSASFEDHAKCHGDPSKPLRCRFFCALSFDIEIKMPEDCSERLGPRFIEQTISFKLGEPTCQQFLGCFNPLSSGPEVEAAACGLMVVSTNVGGVPEVLPLGSLRGNCGSEVMI